MGVPAVEFGSSVVGTRGLSLDTWNVPCATVLPLYG